MKRVNPIASVTAIWSENSRNEYPETIRVPMEDGHVMTYHLVSPHPGFERAMLILKAGAFDGRHQLSGYE